MPTPVSIIVPAHNQLAYCTQCIDSIIANTDHPYRLILVDNGSTDGVAEYFDSIKGAVVVHHERNLGYPAGINSGLRHAEGHVLLLNSDTIVPRQWLSRLVATLGSAPRIGLVGPMSNYVSGPQHIPGLTLTSTAEIDAFADSLAGRGTGLIDVERVVGFCMLIREEAYRAVGEMDESFGIGNFEDDDYCLRVRQAGYRVCIAPDCFVFHYGSRTFQGLGFDDASFQNLIAANQQTFERKWGVSANAGRYEEIARRKLAAARDLRAHNNLKGAIASITEAISLTPRFADAYNELGEVLLELGETQRATEQFRRAVALEPVHAAARLHLERLQRLDLE